MQIISAINWFLEAVNDALDVALPWAALVLMVGYIGGFLARNFIRQRKEIKEQGKSRDTTAEIITQALILAGAAVVVWLGFWVGPGLLGIAFKSTLITTTLRWIEFLGILLTIAYLIGKNNGEKRWLISGLGHAVVIFFGWMVDRWMGVLFISAPLILMFYLILYDLAHIILPASDPDSRDEMKKQFLILAAFTWGIQAPMFVVGEHAWKEPELRIPGSPSRVFPTPGLIRARSHQVVGLTRGNQFTRIDGPGIIFTKKDEHPFQVVDLRLQLRSNEIDVISKDGISFKATVSATFQMDPESWDRETYNTLRTLNPLLQGADRPDQTGGSFPYSHQRVQMALRTTSTRVAESEITLRWDRWALNVIENESRKVLSGKNLDELWKPVDDSQGANALQAIGEEILEAARLPLRLAGILLHSARIVNFSFLASDGSDPISKQKIASWSSEWMRKRAEMHAKARAESERVQKEVRTYAEAQVLNSIADGLRKTQETQPGPPRSATAVRFLAALQDAFHRNSGDENENTETQRKISEAQAFLRNWQEKSLPGSEKDGKQ